MQKISFIFQVIFKISLIFLVVFIWVRYFVRSLVWAIVISAAVTIVIDIITRFISRKKQSAAALKKAEREEAENCFLSLSISSGRLDFFLKLAKLKHPAEKKDGYILVSHSEGEKVMLVPFLSHRALSPDDIAIWVSTAQKLEAQKVVIACGSVAKESFSFAKNFDFEFTLLDQYETYQKLYKEYGLLPEITMKYKKEKALAFKDLVTYSLNRSRAKGYFISALILTISTIFVRATIYYCVVASLLVILALVSLYNPFARNVKKGEIL